MNDKLFNEILGQVADYIREWLAKYPNQDGSHDEPNIYYMNGNDGTDFDWECNDRTCEFIVFYEEEPKLGHIKAYVTKEGKIKGVVWDTQRWQDGVDTEPQSLDRDPDKAQRLAETFMRELESRYDYGAGYDKIVLAL